MSKIIYLDNNGNYPALNCVKAEITQWLSYYSNPSTNNKLTKSVQKRIADAKKVVEKFSGSSQFECIFTSGASESNSIIILSHVLTWRTKSKKSRTLPHFVSSSIEHKSILLLLERLKLAKLLDFTLVQPNSLGQIERKKLHSAIKKNTVFITCMAANNELGAINNIPTLFKGIRKSIFRHTDMVQLFGKYRLNLNKYNIDGASLSLHKFGGPMGFGLLFIRKTIFPKLVGPIGGTQQGGFRGGTENIPYISCLTKLLPIIQKRINSKNKHSIRNRMIKFIRGHYTTHNFCDLTGKGMNSNQDKKKIDQPDIVLFNSPRTKDQLYNTLYLAIRTKDMCNMKVRDYLGKHKNIFIGIGSACNTSNKKASHVLSSLNVPKSIKKGILRISFDIHDKYFERNCEKIMKTIIDTSINFKSN